MMTLDIQAEVARSIAEDLGAGDITAELLPVEQTITAQLISREAAVVCGVPWCNAVFAQIDPSLTVVWQVAEGDRVAPEQTWFTVSGNARSIVTAERTALNWLQTLSGTATVAAQFAAALADSKTRILDTRKTIPGLRHAQKYAVKVGGGCNHRIGLYDAFLIKENHIASCGSIRAALKTARQLHPTALLEIEVETLAELTEALAENPDRIMLDNFSLADMRKAVALAAGNVALEVSGNVELAQLSAIAATGVDYISSGALTKHLRAVDLSMRVSAL